MLIGLSWLTPLLILQRTWELELILRSFQAARSFRVNTRPCLARGIQLLTWVVQQTIYTWEDDHGTWKWTRLFLYNPVVFRFHAGLMMGQTSEVSSTHPIRTVCIVGAQM